MGYDIVCTMIEECGGLDLIEQLQHRENREIYKLAYIINNFFNDNIDEAEQVNTMDMIPGAEGNEMNALQQNNTSGFNF